MSSKTLRSVQVGKFLYSDGVCDNPDILIRHKGKIFSYTLSVAEAHAGWIIGYDLKIDGTGAGCGGRIVQCSKKGTHYYSRKIAAIDAGNIALEYFSNKKHKDLDPLREFIKGLDDVHEDLQDDHHVSKLLTNLQATTAENPVHPGDTVYEVSVAVNTVPPPPIDVNAKKTPLIKFVKMRAPKSSGERNLFAKLCSGHCGDWLNDPHDMNDGERIARNAIKEIQEDPKYKYLRTLSVEVNEKPYYVKIYSSSYVKDAKNEKELIGCFIPYNLTMADLLFKDDHVNDAVNYVTGGQPARYSDQDLAEFEIIVKNKIIAAEGELKYLQGLIDKNDPEIGPLVKLEEMKSRQGSFIGKLRAALSRIQDKSFGICQATGKLIEKTKLTSFPTATTVSLSGAFKHKDLQLKISPIQGIKNNINNLSSSKQSNDMSTTKATQQTNILLSNIIPSPTNKFHREPWELDPKQDPSFAELVESIKQHNIAQPVLVRPNEKAGMYYLVCGERRVTAAKLAGLKEVPAYIRILDDNEAFELQIVENLQRKDVSPMQEANSYKAYMDQFKATIDDLVIKFSKTKDYVMQRLSFLSLIPELAKDFKQGKMGPGHAALFARLTPEDQKKCFDQGKITWGANAGQYKMINDIKEFISSAVMMKLSSAPFSLKDADLVKVAGPCSLCPKRSGAGLFADVSEKDRCFDQGCFSKKLEAFMIQIVTEALEDEDLPLIKLDSTAPFESVAKMIKDAKRTVLKQHTDFTQSSGEGRGVIKALIISGATQGRYQHIKLIKQAPKLRSSPSGEKISPTISHKTKLESAHTAVKMVQAKVDNTYYDKLENKLFDFKPFVQPDPKPLTKYEMAAFLMSLDDELFIRSFGGPMARVKVPGMKVSDPGYKVEQFASIPPDLANLLMRAKILEFMRGSGDSQPYLLTKLAEENKAIKMDVLRQESVKKYEKEMATATKRLQELGATVQQPAKPAAKKPASKK